jgi:hypothetical protein
MTQPRGLLGFLHEAAEIQIELDCSFDRAMEVQRERAEQRAQESMPTNVIQFRPRGADGLA